jgi:tRNA(Ile)-lysidine synthase
VTTDPIERIAGHFAETPPDDLAVAVSGGSDSTALLIALSDWQGGPRLHVVTVDHGLRPEARDEIAAVAALCAELGLSHEVLHWTWDGAGNLMAEARAARYRLMADWAKGRGIADVALGHTRDDVAETLVMRLSRGAGLDGLSAMRPRVLRQGVTFHRPFLELARDDLRAMLRKRGIGWSEDATNSDPAYDRARVRLALTTLELDTAQLARTAAQLAEARDALGEVAAWLAEAMVHFDEGDILIEAARWREQPRDIRRRLLLAALRYVSGADYGPRGAEMERLIDATEKASAMTLHGCHVLHRKGKIRITREAAAVALLRAAPEAIWDGRWSLEGPQDHPPSLHVAVLGERGLALCPDRKATGRPAISLAASPAVWAQERLIAAPLAGFANGWAARLLVGPDRYFDLLRGT